VYSREIPLKTAIRITRVRMFLLGIPFDVIDAMSLQDFGDVIAFWKEDNAADEKLARDRKSLSGKK
jgi:hypothetical protein